MATYRRLRPAIGCGGILRTVIDTGVPAEVSSGWLSRGWEYYGTDSGGPYLPFFGAPAIEPPSSYGPTTVSGTGIWTGDGPTTDWAVLGGWAGGSQGPGTLYTALKSDWAQKTFTGLTPGSTVGFTFSFDYVLDSGGGYVFGEIEGETLNNFYGLSSGPTFWTFENKPNIVGGYISTVVPASGEVIVRMGWKDMGPSGANGQGTFGDFELVLLNEGGERPKLLVFGTPLFEVMTYPKPGDGSAWSSRFPSGARDSWLTPSHDYLTGRVAHIPIEDRERIGGPNDLDASGWDGADGWRTFLEYARNGGMCTWYPDQRNLALDPTDFILVEPFTGEPGLDVDMKRTFTLTARTLDPAERFAEY